MRTCVANTCGFSFQPNGSPGIPALTQTSGPCKKEVCDGAGNVITVNDDLDLPIDGIQCTQDLCANGAPSNPAAPLGAQCSQGGAVCDGSGACVACNVAADCTGGNPNCQTATCQNHVCGSNPQPQGSPGVPPIPQTPGDCQVLSCDGLGGTASAMDDLDLPADSSECTTDTCLNGVPTFTTLPEGAPCSGGTCDANGICGQCNVPSDCPGSDDECQHRTCVNNVCGMGFEAQGSPGNPALPQTPGDCMKATCDGSGGASIQADDTDVPPSDGNECTTDTCSNGIPYAFVSSGTPTATQTPGNCKIDVCDGAGGTSVQDDDTDVLVDGNECSSDICTAGVPSNPNAPIGTGCTVNGNACDGAGVCIHTVMVVRVGDGSALANGTAAPTFVEERKLDGTLFGQAGNPIALPTVAGGGNFRFTMSNSATSEGGLSRSGDGKYVVMGGFDADPGTASIAGTTTAATNRVIGRIDRSYAVDTSTKLTTAFSASDIRSACSSNGTDLWAAGNGSSGSGGVWHTTLGMVAAGTQVLSTPGNVRHCHVFSDQLYASASSVPYVSVFTVGSGLPVATGQTATALAGLPTAMGPSAYSFVFFDTDNDNVLDKLYVADDRTNASGGIYKWTSSDGITWSAGAATPINVGGSNGVRGLAGFLSGGVVTLIATTTQSAANTLYVVTDDLSNAVVTKTLVATAGANTAFRGVALGVH